MKSNEVNNNGTVDYSIAKEIEQIERWFRNEYVQRRLTVDRHTFLNLTKPETRFDLETEAYQKEQRLRELKGYPKLPEIKIGTLI